MSVKRKKPNFMNNILIDTIDRGEELIRTDILSESIKLFQNRKVSLEIETNTQNIIKESNTNWNQEAQNNLNNLINGNNFDLVKEANEKYNTLRNTLFLEILEKYKNNNEKDCLSYEYLYKRILDSYDLLDEYDTTKYTNIPRSVYLDNKIRVHNMVMKLICGSKQMEHSSSMVIPLSGNLSQIIKHFHNGKSHTKVEYTDNKKQSFSKQKEIITLDEIDRVVEELDKMNNINKDLDIDINGNIIEIGNLIQNSDVLQNDKLINDNLIDNNKSTYNDLSHKDFNRIESITNDSRYQLFLKRTSPTLLKLCDTPEEFVIKYEEVIKEKGIINDAVLKKKKLGSIKDLEVLPGIPPLEDVKWVKRDLNKFNACVIRYKNNFSLYKSEIPHIPTKELIKKYYLSKDKTFSHIKKKPGRISDSEIKIIVENEWSQSEIEIFKEKYSLFGNNLVKYQSWINKTEKELKIFLRYFLKQQKTQKIEIPHRPSLTREDILSCWSIDERQIFAIYFPYFNKNWITMATYFPKKTSSDLKMYYAKYFKGLSYNEQKFEASISNLKIKNDDRTDPVILIGDDSFKDEYLECVGIIFKK